MGMNAITVPGQHYKLWCSPGRKILLKKIQGKGIRV